MIIVRVNTHLAGEIEYRADECTVYRSGRVIFSPIEWRHRGEDEWHRYTRSPIAFRSTPLISFGFSDRWEILGRNIDGTLRRELTWSDYDHAIRTNAPLPHRAVYGE